ncbi:MAG: LamG-like jellyroll fold domain-containing protein, partial [Euryarchaeota archaeon]|nr:LamG-like jellyroll fold domain-containing protein [Euryarchaeota archaeon]
LYVNGDKEASKPFDTTVTTTPGTVYIGSNYGHYRSFEGIIDEVKILPRAVSAHEIKDRYDELKP